MVTEQCDPRFYRSRCFSWGAVFAGALIGTGISFLLNLFNLGIGLSAVKTTPDGLMTLAIGGFIGMLIGTIVATFAGGFVAGYLGRPYFNSTRCNLGAVYGFAAWCLALVFMICLTTHIGRYVTYYSGYIADPSTIIVVNDQQTPAVTQTPNNKNVVVNAQAATNRAGHAAFIMFILFFVGALSSCIGGHLAMTCLRCDDEIPPNRV